MIIVYGSEYEDPKLCTNPQIKKIVGVFDDEVLAKAAASKWLEENPSGEAAQQNVTLNEVLD